MNRSLSKIMVGLLVPALMLDPVVASALGPSPATHTSLPRSEREGSLYGWNALGARLLAVHPATWRGDMHLPFLGLMWKAHMQLLMPGMAPHDFSSTPRLPHARVLSEVQGHDLSALIADELRERDPRIEIKSQAHLTYDAQTFSFELWGRAQPKPDHSHILFARVGYLFFMLEETARGLSDESREELGANLILMKPESTILNPDLSIHTAASMVPVLAEPIEGYHSVDLGAAGGTLAVVDARRGATSFDLVEKMMSRVYQARQHLPQNGIPENSARFIPQDLTRTPSVVNQLTHPDKDTVVHINLGRWEFYPNTSNETGLAIVRQMPRTRMLIVGGYHVLSHADHRDDYLRERAAARALGFETDPQKVVRNQLKSGVEFPLCWVGVRKGRFGQSLSTEETDTSMARLPPLAGSPSRQSPGRPTQTSGEEERDLRRVLERSGVDPASVKSLVYTSTGSDWEFVMRLLDCLPGIEQVYLYSLGYQTDPLQHASMVRLAEAAHQKSPATFNRSIAFDVRAESFYAAKIPAHSGRALVIDKGFGKNSEFQGNPRYHRALARNTRVGDLILSLPMTTTVLPFKGLVHPDVFVPKYEHRKRFRLYQRRAEDDELETYSQGYARAFHQYLLESPGGDRSLETVIQTVHASYLRSLSKPAEGHHMHSWGTIGHPATTVEVHFSDGSSLRYSAVDGRLTVTVTDDDGAMPLAMNVSLVVAGMERWLATPAKQRDVLQLSVLRLRLLHVLGLLTPQTRVFNMPAGGDWFPGLYGSEMWIKDQRLTESESRAYFTRFHDQLGGAFPAIGNLGPIHYAQEPMVDKQGHASWISHIRPNDVLYLKFAVEADSHWTVAQNVGMRPLPEHAFEHEYWRAQSRQALSRVLERLPAGIFVVVQEWRNPLYPDGYFAELVQNGVLEEPLHTWASKEENRVLSRINEDPDVRDGRILALSTMNRDEPDVRLYEGGRLSIYRTARPSRPTGVAIPLEGSKGTQGRVSARNRVVWNAVPGEDVLPGRERAGGRPGGSLREVDADPTVSPERDSVFDDQDRDMILEWMREISRFRKPNADQVEQVLLEFLQQRETNPALSFDTFLNVAENGTRGRLSRKSKPVETAIPEKRQPSRKTKPVAVESRKKRQKINSQTPVVLPSLPTGGVRRRSLTAQQQKVIAFVTAHESRLGGLTIQYENVLRKLYLGPRMTVRALAASLRRTSGSVQVFANNAFKQLQRLVESDQMSDRELVSQNDHRLEMLGARRATLLRDRFVKGRSLQEMGDDRGGISKTAVASQLKTALQRLRTIAGSGTPSTPGAGVKAHSPGAVGLASIGWWALVEHRDVILSTVIAGFVILFAHELMRRAWLLRQRAALLERRAELLQEAETLPAAPPIPFSQEERERAIDAETIHTEVLVLGIGAAGASTASHAAQLGLPTVLAGAGDFSEGASGNNTSLAHAGIRYVAKAWIRYVLREAREVLRLMEIAPHWVESFPFVLVVFAGGRFGMRMLQVGVHLYERLFQWAAWSLGKRDVGEAISLSPDEVQISVPSLKKDQLLGGFLYPFDARLRDARFTLGFAQQAAARGVTVINHARAIGFVMEPDLQRPMGVLFEDELQHRRFTVFAHVIINATGPWIDEVRQLIHPDASPLLTNSLGIHLVVERIEGKPLIFPLPDDRVFFVLPMAGGRSLVGTTEKRHDGAPDEARATEEGVRELVDHLFEFFPSLKPEQASPEEAFQQYVKSEVRQVYWGLRPLGRQSGSTSGISRDHAVVKEGRLWSILGMKLTAARAVGEEVARHLWKARRGAWPQAHDLQPLPGGHFASFDRYLTSSRLLYPHQPPERLAYLIRQYGTYYQKVLSLLVEDSHFALSVLPDQPWVLAEVAYAARYEMVLTLNDFLWRRSRWAREAEIPYRQVREIAAILRAELGWSAEETERQVKDFFRELDAHRPSSITLSRAA